MDAPSLDRSVSLAAGVALDASPDRLPGIAADAGFDAVGIWFDAESWDDAMTRRVAAAVRAAGVSALDIEPIILGRGDDHGERLIDAGAEIGARFALVASIDDSHSAVVERLGALADRARGSGLRLVLEFLPIFGVATLADAISIVEQVASPDVGVLVDTLHLDRSGGTPADLAVVDPARLPYLQLADAPSSRPRGRAALYEEAVHGRLLLGDGDLPLRDVLGAVPDVPISIELRSRMLMQEYPDPLARARAVRSSVEALTAAG